MWGSGLQPPFSGSVGPSAALETGVQSLWARLEQIERHCRVMGGKWGFAKTFPFLLDAGFEGSELLAK